MGGAAKAQLTGEEAALRLRCCEHAFTAGQWLDALQHHDALLELVVALARALPAQAAGFWTRYGALLAALTAAVHGAVHGNNGDPPPPPLRAELCWRMAERLKLGHGLPFEPPDWLAVLEQQLVQTGATQTLDLLKEAGPAAQPAARAQAVRLLVRLDRILQPAPDWVLILARQQLQELARQLLASEPAPEPRALAELADLLEALPVEQERQDQLAAVLTRLRLGLELLDPSLAPLAAPGTTPPCAPAKPATPPAASPQPAQAGEPGSAGMVLLGPGGLASPLELDLTPLLEAEPEAIEAALDDFVWHLPRGSRALPAATTLLAALEPAWHRGLRLTEPAFAQLAYLAAAWQRRLAEKLEPLPSLDWQHSLLIELEATELSVLAPLLAAPATLEPALVELRRQHHNTAFWQARQELPWMECLPPLEALRRLHVERGFYARSHEPLQALAGWGREVVQALLEGELWTDDAACLGLWLRLAQTLVTQNLGPLPPLGAPPAADHLLAELAGLEVLYVGDHAVAVRAAHRAGRCFRGEPFGLRVLETPASRWPARPASSFEESLAVLLEAVDGLYRQRPFAVLLADCGAYRLPLLRAVHQRYGVAALSTGLPMVGWLGAA